PAIWYRCSTLPFTVKPAGSFDPGVHRPGIGNTGLYTAKPAQAGFAVYSPVFPMPGRDRGPLARGEVAPAIDAGLDKGDGIRARHAGRGVVVGRGHLVGSGGCGRRAVARESRGAEVVLLRAADV